MADTPPVTDTPAAFIPQHPFDDPTADVILTSPDGIDFHVHRVVLSLLSPVFKAMFTLPQPPDEPKIHPIPMAESTVLLDRMLRFCYPGAEPVVNSMDELREVLDVAVLKYDIQCVVPVAKKYLKDYMDGNALRVFAIACRYEWMDLAKDAARSSLTIPIRSFFSPSFPDLRYVTANHYHALLQYHAACSRVAVDDTTNLRWIVASPTDTVWFSCRSCSTQTYRWYLSDGELWSIRDWFLLYMKAARKMLKVQPLARLDDPKLMHGAVKAMASCPTCRAEGFEQLEKFASDNFGPQIVAKINTVILNLDF
ncbi:hypothetical protein DFH09DRAFT_1045597 [Mycena vulgaris]|nr:hypothetical protein DFH09DRAFT_1045597 [Mycena vulgaris]